MAALAVCIIDEDVEHSHPPQHLRVLVNEGNDPSVSAWAADLFPAGLRHLVSRDSIHGVLFCSGSVSCQSWAMPLTGCSVAQPGAQHDLTEISGRSLH